MVVGFIWSSRGCSSFHQHGGNDQHWQQHVKSSDMEARGVVGSGGSGEGGRNGQRLAGRPG